MSDLAVLLRDGTNSGATNRYALKVDQLTISAGRQPIQIPMPGTSPIILDLGQTRPTITISGIMDNIGQDTTNTTQNAYFNMEKLTIQGQTYYVPYKNHLESKLLTWSTGDDLELEVGDATTPDYSGSGTTASTGGGIYKVMIAQFQFSVAPALEDRWQFSVQFVSEWRTGIS